MDKFKKVILIYFIMFCGDFTFAQPYQKMLGVSNEWYQAYVGEGGTTTLLWKTTSDTILGTYVYKKIESFSTIGSIYYECRGFIREDTLLKKIYYRYCGTECALPCDTGDLTIYDFSGLPGDTVSINLIADFSTSPRSFIIDSIRIDTTFSLNRIYHLHATSDLNWQLSWAEGIGSLTGLEDNLSLAGNSLLICAFKDSIQTLRNYYPDFPDQCIINWTGIEEEINSRLVEVSPNPSAFIFKVESTEPCMRLVSVRLFSITGQELISRQFQNYPQSTIIDTQLLSPGIYFCQITLSNGEKNIKKVFIE